VSSRFNRKPQVRVRRRDHSRLTSTSRSNQRVCGETSRANYETRAEAEAEREKEIEYRKGQSGNIYSFELVWGQTKGEEISKPKLIYRDKEQPNYGAAK
jgi:hypothetical protein